MSQKINEISVEEFKKSQEKINELENMLAKKDEEIENLKLQLDALTRYVFGSKRESTPKSEVFVDGTQCSFFGEVEDKEIQEKVDEKTEEIIVHRKKNSKKQSSGIKKSEMKNVEKEEIIVELNDEQLLCPECGSKLIRIGSEIVRQEVQIIPAKLKLVTYIRYTYKCVNCGTENSEKETPTIVKPKVPRPLLSHSFVSSSLATEVIYEKYYKGVPLYRQEKTWDDKGLVLPRNMMANWCIKLCQYYLEPIYQLMLKKLKNECELIHCDETTIQCNKEEGKKASSNSYMWVVTSGELEEKKGVIFSYSRSRSAETAQKLLKDYEGILVTDGYQGYNNIENVTRAKCWAHQRRYFYDSIPLDENKKMVTTSLGYAGVKYIDELFRIERKIENLSPEEKVVQRKEKSEPILKKYYEWVNLTSSKYITNAKLRKAIVYAQNHKEGLLKFLEDGRIPLTNSKAERAIRPFAVHRKNWLFADTVEGAKANAIYYSLIESAKANNLNISKYIKYLLDELSQLEEAQTEEEIEKYLPWSKELPEDILNYQGTYDELDLK